MTMHPTRPDQTGAEHDAPREREEVFDNPVEAREWALQEAARHAHRTDGTPEGSARALRYRIIAAGLDAPPDTALPSNFAYVQAQRIEALVAERRRADARFERRLRWGFALGYGGLIALVVLVYRRALFDGLASSPVADLVADPWLPWLLGCAAFVYLLSRRSRRWHRHDGGH